MYLRIRNKMNFIFSYQEKTVQPIAAQDTMMMIIFITTFGNIRRIDRINPDKA